MVRMSYSDYGMSRSSGSTSSLRHLSRAQASAKVGHGFPPQQIETIPGVGGGRHVQRAVELASPGQVVRGGAVGTPVSHLHRNDQGIRESNDQWKTAGLTSLHGAAGTNLGRGRFRSHACRKQSAHGGSAERLAGGNRAK